VSRLIRGFRRRIGAELYGATEKTIHDEETSDVDLAESMADLKVRCYGMGENRR
jgi:hypothetical protein